MFDRGLPSPPCATPSCSRGSALTLDLRFTRDTTWASVAPQIADDFGAPRKSAQMGLSRLVHRRQTHAQKRAACVIGCGLHVADHQEMLMNIYKELDIIDDFQEKRGLRESVRRVCDLTVSYIDGLQKPLPEIAAKGLSVAVKCKEGSSLPGEVEAARMQIRDSLDTQYPYRIEHVVCYILGCYGDLARERGLASYDNDFPSEFASNCLATIDTFDRNHELFRKLLREYFHL